MQILDLRVVFDVAIEKYEDHPSIKMIIENVSFESRFSSKEIWESEI